MDRRLDTPPLLPYKVKVLDDLMGEELRGGSKVDPMGSSGSRPLYRRGLGGGEVVGRGGFRGGVGESKQQQNHLKSPPSHNNTFYQPRPIHIPDLFPLTRKIITFHIP